MMSKGASPTNFMPQDKTKANTVVNHPNGSTHMEVEPLDPRQGQPIDATVPHALDQVLPDVRPGVQQPSISPIGPMDSLHAAPGTVRPGQYNSGSTGIKKA